jgi:hypothetical protein
MIIVPIVMNAVSFVANISDYTLPMRAEGRSAPSFHDISIRITRPDGTARR